MVITACRGRILTCCTPACRCRRPCQPTMPQGRSRRQMAAVLHQVFQQAHALTGKPDHARQAPIAVVRSCSTPPAPEAHSCLRQAQHCFWASRT